MCLYISPASDEKLANGRVNRIKFLNCLPKEFTKHCKTSVVFRLGTNLTLTRIMVSDLAVISSHPVHTAGIVMVVHLKQLSYS